MLRQRPAGVGDHWAMLSVTCLLLEVSCGGLWGGGGWQFCG